MSANRLMPRQPVPDLSVPLVNSSLSMKRIPPKQREWTGGAHPGPNIYHEIAVDVTKQVRALRGSAEL